MQSEEPMGPRRDAETEMSHALEEKQPLEELVTSNLRAVERSSLTAAFDPIVDQLPATLGLERDAVREIVQLLIDELPPGWSTPRELEITAQPYDGGASDAVRLVRADLSAAATHGDALELLKARVVPTLRRLEDNGVSREELVDVLIPILGRLPDSESRSSLLRHATRHLLGEPDPDKKTTYYHVSLVNLANAITDKSYEAEMESAVLNEYVLTGMCDLQRRSSVAFSPTSPDGRQVHIAAHNMAASILRVSQQMDDSKAVSLAEAQRLEVLSAAFDVFERPPTPAEASVVAEQLGLTPFLTPDGPNADPGANALIGLQVVNSIGSIGKASSVETYHDALVSAASACAAFGWSDRPGSSAVRLFNASVSLARIGRASGREFRLPRTILFCLGVGAAFRTSSLEEALVDNNGLNIAAAFSDSAGRMAEQRAAPAFSLIATLASLVGTYGLTSASAGPLRGDAVRIVDSAANVPQVGPVELTTDAISAEAGAVASKLAGFEASPHPLWSTNWLAAIIGRIFDGPLAPVNVAGGLLESIPEWIRHMLAPKSLLESYGTDRWRGERWVAPPIYAEDVTIDKWTELERHVREPGLSPAAALVSYISAQ